MLRQAINGGLSLNGAFLPKAKRMGRGTAGGGGGGSAGWSGPVLISGLSDKSRADPSTLLRRVPLPSALRFWGGFSGGL